MNITAEKTTLFPGSKTKILFTLSISFVFISSIGVAVAQQQPIGVDKLNYLIGEQVEISGFVSTPTSFEKTIELTNPRITDSLGNSLKLMDVYEQIQIAADLKNLKNTEQPFAFLVKIQNSKHETIYLEWVKGTISAEKSATTALHWKPNFSDKYELSIFVWEDFNKPTALSPKVTFLLAVDSLGRVSYSTPEYSSPKSNLFIDEITLRVYHIDGNLVEIDQFPYSGNAFFFIYQLDKHLPKPLGEYFVNIQKGDSPFTTTFTLDEKSPKIFPPIILDPKPEAEPIIKDESIPKADLVPKTKPPVICGEGTELIEGRCVLVETGKQVWKDPITIASSIGVAAAGGVLLLLMKGGLITGSKITTLSAGSSGAQASNSSSNVSHDYSIDNSNIEQEYDPFAKFTEIELEVRGGLE